MNDFDAEYEKRLTEARDAGGNNSARVRGRNDVLDYLDLRATNDVLRADGLQWLLETFMAFAGEANRAGAGLNLARTDAHRFRVGHSTMVGARLTFNVGIRHLSIEAGWPRTPRDGIVRGNGLASAQVSHFGDAAAGEEMLLVASESGAARWFVLAKSGTRHAFDEDGVRRHFNHLLDAK